jgi:hypothetical protein
MKARQLTVQSTVPALEIAAIGRKIWEGYFIITRILKGLREGKNLDRIPTGPVHPYPGVLISFILLME